MASEFLARGERSPKERQLLGHIGLSTERAQRMIADDYVNVYLFQLAKTGVADARLRGLWLNGPTQANDLTGVYWEQ